MNGAAPANPRFLQVLVVCLLVGAMVYAAAPLAAQDVRFVYGGGSSIIGARLDVGASSMTAIPGSPFPTRASLSYSLVVHPSGKFLYAANDGAVSGFTIDPTTGALTEMAGSPFVAGGGYGPKAIVIDASGKYLYVAYSTAYYLNGQPAPFGSLNAYSIDQSTGALTPIALVQQTPPQLWMQISPPVGVGMLVNPTIEAIYLVNSQGASAFSIDSATGRLSSGWAILRPNPQTIAITPDGKLLFVGWADRFLTGLSGRIESYQIDANGTLIFVNDMGPFQRPVPTVLVVDGSGSFLYGYGGGFVINTANGALFPLSPSQSLPAFNNLFLDPGNEFIYGNSWTGYYQVAAGGTLAHGPNSTITFNAAYATVGIPPVIPEPPTITTQPVSQATIIGQTATFTVVASGTPAPVYQWKKNNMSIPGATSASYTTPPATINDDGATYRVGIQNSLGGVASNVATLSVPHSSASIATQLVGVTVSAGQTATFTVVGAGTAPLIYQWRKNNISIPGATSASYTTPTATLADNGTRYAVSVSNSFSGVASNVVTLNVAGAATVPPAITTQPLSQTVGIGQTATFTVVASGDGTLSYQWKKNNVSIPGATSASYTTPPATINDDGATYRVGIQNNLGGVTSSVATLSVPHTSASITTQPISLTVSASQTATFTVVGAGTAPLIYQWRKNNISIPGATSASYATPPTTLADDGAQYAVSVSNSFSGVPSNVVTLHVSP
jgi:6-phosphogluconolactonase (cycloisomerase 2 family)